MAAAVLIESLEVVRRRVRMLGVGLGIGWVATAIIAMLLTVVFADYFLNLHSLPRMVLAILALGTAGYCIWRWVILSVMSRLTLNDIASRIEKTYPQYQDRLSSTVDILAGVDIPGSQVMKQRVVSEATRLTQSLDLNRVVLFQPVWYSAGGAMSAVLVLSMLMSTVSPDYSRVAFRRLFSPFSANPWPRMVNIDLIGSVPDRISVGQRLDVNIRLSHGDKAGRKSIIFYQYGDESGAHLGPVQQEYMTRGDDGTYHASIDARIPSDAAIGSMKIWMESGDDSKQLPAIKVVQRLTISRVDAVITPPPYARLQPMQVNLSQAPAVVTFGSKIQISAAFNKSLDASQPVNAEILSGKSKPIFTWAAPAGAAVTGTVDAGDSFRFHLHGLDIDGLTNSATEEFEVVVRPDQNPTVVIENPRRNEDRTPQATVPLQAVVEDDFGITSLKMVVDRLGDKKHWEIPLVEAAGPAVGTQWNRLESTGELQRYRANYTWELSALKEAKLQPGDVLEYYASVKDNYQLGSQSHSPVASGKLRLTIISQEELSNKVTDALRTVAEQTAVLRQSQGTTQRQTAQLNKDVASKNSLDNADKAAAERLSAQQGTIASQTKSLATKVAELQSRMDENKSNNQEIKDTAKDVQNLLNGSAENPMKNAAGQITNARQSDQKEVRDQALSEAQMSQSKAGDDLQKVLERMGNIGSLSRSIEGIRALLADQQKVSSETAAAGKNTLGKTPDQLTAQENKKLDALVKEQTELATRTAKAVEDIARDAQKLDKFDPTASKAMSQAADTGNQQNVAGNQSKAADAAQQNQQSQAQSAQKQAELGLQMMLADLREAEKHKLDELSRKLTELAQQLAILVRQQAGHNLDNLALQGGAVLDRISPAVKMDLYTWAERDPKGSLPQNERPMLSSAQEQTERNARDIAKAAGDLPDGSEPADRLTQAADKMERAIINLRESKLREAYDPPQVDALATLVQAKKLIDQQKKKADQKQEDQKKESVRQAYMALLAQQNEVDIKTAAIDVVPRNEDGSLPRETMVRLGQLPAEQGKVADDAGKLDQDLSALGSIVYSWANRDIVKNMNQAKDQLGQSQTGLVTQALQKQIVAQLEAMIRDLTTKPEDSKFAQHAGGDSSGGGAGGGSNIPTEAELRLIKDLQIAENDATISISKQAPPDKSDLQSVGGRQGDLRNLLDKLLQNASKGQSKLPPEPDNKDQLPEEKAGTAATVTEKVDNQELEQDLIGTGKIAKTEKTGEPAAEAQRDLNVIGDRMGRARQRLAMNNDPGMITQEIQKRILENMDDLIEQARKKQAQGQNQPPQPGGKPGQQQPPKPSSGAQPQNADAGGKPKPAQANAGGNNPGGGDGAPGTAPADLARQQARMWGSITPRQRDAVIESEGEKVLDKYKNLVDDYYRTLSTRALAH